MSRNSQKISKPGSTKSHYYSIIHPGNLNGGFHGVEKTNPGGSKIVLRCNGNDQSRPYTLPLVFLDK